MRKNAVLRFFRGRCNALEALKGPSETNKIWFAVSSFALVPFFAVFPTPVIRRAPDLEWDSNYYCCVSHPRKGVFGRVSCRGTLHLFCPTGRKFRYWRGPWQAIPPANAPEWVKKAWHAVPPPEL